MLVIGRRHHHAIRLHTRQQLAVVQELLRLRLQLRTLLQIGLIDVANRGANRAQLLELPHQITAPAPGGNGGVRHAVIGAEGALRNEKRRYSKRPNETATISRHVR